MAKRSDKDKNKIRKMLKVTKSANRSVLEDAISKTDTAVTLEGPEQPDEDDYGYTSHEASALYKKMMDKYKSMPEDKQFANSSRQSKCNGDLRSTKDRVREAILREKEEEKLGRKQRPTTSTIDIVSSSQLPSEHRHRSRKNLYDPKAEDEQNRKRKEEEDQRRKMKMRMKKPPPPAVDYQKLLKIAEEKQHQPIEIEVVPKQKEPERLLTSKEKREIEMRKAQLEERERNKKLGIQNRSSTSTGHIEEQKTGLTSNGRIPKLNGSNASMAKPKLPNQLPLDNRKTIVPASKDQWKSKSNVPSSSNNNNKSNINNNNFKAPTASSKQIHSHNMNDRKSIDLKAKNGQSHNASLKMPSKSHPTINRTIESKTIRAKELPAKELQKPKAFPPNDLVKRREFSPRDLQRREMSMKRKQLIVQNRRIIDDDDDEEDEEDSEMDDFIDDDDQELDYSKHIKDIFGYDKHRYRNDDYDSDNMESNFAQQQREEQYSKRMGIKEDLEDMRLEEEERKRKKAKRKRLS